MGRINRRIYATRRKKSSALKSLVVDGQVVSGRGMQNQQSSGPGGLFGRIREKVKTKTPGYLGGSEKGLGEGGETYTITEV